MTCKIKTKSSSAGQIHLILPFLPYFLLLAFTPLTLTELLGINTFPSSLHLRIFVIILPLALLRPPLPPFPSLLLCLCKSLSQLLPLPQQLWSLLVSLFWTLMTFYLCHVSAFIGQVQEALAGDRRVVAEEGSQERCHHGGQSELKPGKRFWLTASSRASHSLFWDSPGGLITKWRQTLTWSEIWESAFLTRS